MNYSNEKHKGASNFKVRWERGAGCARHHAFVRWLNLRVDLGFSGE